MLKTPTRPIRLDGFLYAALEAESFGEANYASRLVKLLCLAISIVSKELASQQQSNPLIQSTAEVTSFIAEVRENASVCGPTILTPRVVCVSAQSDDPAAAERLKSAEGRVRDLEAQVEAMLEWNNEQGEVNSPPDHHHTTTTTTTTTIMTTPTTTTRFFLFLPGATSRSSLCYSLRH